MSKKLITYVQQRGFDLRSYGYDIAESEEDWINVTKELEEEQESQWQYILINSVEISDEFAERWEGNLT